MSSIRSVVVKTRASNSSEYKQSLRWPAKGAAPWSSLVVWTNNYGNSSGRFMTALVAFADLLFSLSLNFTKYSPFINGTIK